MNRVLAFVFLSVLWTHGKLVTIDAGTLLKMQKKGVPVIDIRTPGEWRERGIIPGAHTMMFFDERGEPHIRSWLRRLSTLIHDKKEPFIIYCAHANRTKVLGRWLSDTMGFSNVYELKGGIEYGWKEAGRSVVKPRR